MRNLLQAKQVQRSLLLVITTVFCATSMTAPIYAFDKDFFASNDILFYNDTCANGNTPAAQPTAPSQYIAAGKIPIDGLKVGASVFGGKQEGGQWIQNLADNHGNDLGNHNNHLTGTTSFAELGTYDPVKQVATIGGSLGNLPDGTKLEIDYNGNKIIAEKGDNGAGGPDVAGTPRKVDLWWETANLLRFQDGTGIVTIHAVPSNTPVTPLNGTPSTAVPDTTTSTATNSGACCATVDTSAGTLVGNTNAEKIWNFLTSAPRSLTPEQAAGVMGNIKAESDYNPDAREPNGIGYGIVQWSFGRRTQLEAAAAKKGVKVSDLAFQLEYMYQESMSRSSLTIPGTKEWDGLKRQTTILASTIYWHANFERSADSAQQVSQGRGGFANDAYKSFANKSAATAGAGPSTATGTSKPVIFVDPGHGGSIPAYIDQKTGLKADETANTPEREDVLAIANRIKTTLDPLGYEVVLSRTGNEQVKFRERSDKAASVHAALALSIHTSPGNVNQAWPQRVGTYRDYNGHRDTFTNAATAKVSENAANVFAKSRSAAEGHTVTTDPGNVQETASFGRGGNIYSTGNIPFVSLWSPTVPWVYNEIGQDQPNGGISDSLKNKYTQGLIDAIKQSVPPAGQNGSCSDSFNVGAGGNFAQTVLAYAWPDYYPPVHLQAQPAYTKAVGIAQSQGRYVGGLSHPGIDCGGFVTTLMVDSGYEPKYNYGGKLSAGAGITTVQAQWAHANWQTLGAGGSFDVATLKPGDVAISGEHTFVYVGNISPNFHSKVASASVSFTGLSWRAPMAGRESLVSPAFTWYHKR